MKPRFTLFRRGGVYYCQDTQTREQLSLRTKDKTGAHTLRNLAIFGTRAEHFLRVLESAEVAANSNLRRIHSFALDMDWLPCPVIPKIWGSLSPVCFLFDVSGPGDYDGIERTVCDAQWPFCASAPQTKGLRLVRSIARRLFIHLPGAEPGSDGDSGS